MVAHHQRITSWARLYLPALLVLQAFWLCFDSQVNWFHVFAAQMCEPAFMQYHQASSHMNEHDSK